MIGSQSVRAGTNAHAWLAIAVAGVLAFAVTAEAKAQTVVVDGDTIRIGSTTYRLWGIDAPEQHQSCADWPAGVEATRALSDLMRDKAVTCEHRTQDRYGRSVAVCRADGMDLGAAMVSAGMAWAFVRYSNDYVGGEDSARAAGLGVHAHACIPAWEWRATQRSR